MALSLSTVETAINTIQTTGQSVSIEGMSYTAANIGELMDLRKTIIQETNKANTTLPAFRGFDFSNMGY